MKKVALIVLGLVLVSGTAFAAGPGGSGVSLDLSGNYASEPTGDFGGTLGPEFGVNINLNCVGLDVGATRTVEFQGRASLSWYSWDESIAGEDFDYRRIPIFVGARVLSPVAPQFKVYGQLGLELSFDRLEFPVPGGRASDSDTHLGLTPGVGILFPVSNQLYVGGNLSWHIIDHDYFTLGVTVGFNL